MPRKRTPLHHRAVDWITSLSYTSIFLVWMLVILLFAITYLILSYAAGAHAPTRLAEMETLVRAGNSIYFSVVTATTIGYGDIVPHGISKALASVEGIVGFLLFAVLVTKLVSHKQEIALQQMHRLSFEESYRHVREGLFIVRKDFDAAMHEAQEHRRLEPSSWDNLLIAFKEAHMLIESLPDFYDTDGLYVIDTKREELLIEAVHRTLQRTLQLLDVLEKLKPSWPERAALLTELRSFAKSLRKTVRVWQDRSPHGGRVTFASLRTGSAEMEKKVLRMGARNN